MQIYFCGSIRGGRSDADLYRRLVDLLRSHGEVLSEHVGDDDVEGDEAEMTDGDIHDRDVEWLREADVVVAEVTTPSLGVGYEVAKAEEWGTPVLCLYRPAGDHRLSAMIRGSDRLRVVEYDDPSTLESAFAAFVDEHHSE